MAHGHRRRHGFGESSFDEYRGSDDRAGDLAAVDVAIAEVLEAAPAREPTANAAAGFYLRYPRYLDPLEAEDAFLARSWNPDDSRIQRLLQPGDPDGSPAPRSGGGGASGRRAARKPRPAKSKRRDDPAVEVVEKRDTVRMNIEVTRGVAEFFHNRRGEARAILCDLGMHIVANVMLYPRVGRPQFGPKRETFVIYGIPVDLAAALKIYSGEAAKALESFAHRHDHERIIERDRAVIEKWAHTSVVREWKAAERVQARLGNESFRRPRGDALACLVEERLRAIELGSWAFGLKSDLNLTEVLR